MNKIFLLLFSNFVITNLFANRSIHRTQDPNIGSISVCFEGESDVYHLKHIHLKEFPIFKTYNEEYLLSKQIPDEISLRYEPNKTVKRADIEEKLYNLLKEINAGKKKFTDFKILKKRDFDYFKKTGLLVLKFKDEKFPFFFKIFIENPASFVKPDKKSFQVRGVFVLGGTFRHIVGYTRIRNIDLIQERIKDHPKWSEKVKLPRKWFWVPENNKTLVIKGYNLGDKEEQEIKLPAIYGLLCDEIKEDEKKDNKIKIEYLKFCSFLEYTLDPLPSNFKKGKNGEIILIDTEHFATLIGIDKKFKHYERYCDYWPKLIGKYLKDRLFSCKEERIERQKQSFNHFPLY